MKTLLVLFSLLTICCVEAQEKKVRAVNSVFDLLTLNPEYYDTDYIVEGYTNTADGGAALFRYYNSNIATNATTVFAPNGNYSGRWIMLGLNLALFDTNSFTVSTNSIRFSGAGVTNVYSTNLYSSNIFVYNTYTTNLYSSNAYVTNMYVQQEFYSSNSYITNLTVTQNIRGRISYISNLYVTNLFIGTNQVFAYNFNTNQFATNTEFMVSIKNEAYTTNLYTRGLLGAYGRFAMGVEYGTVTATFPSQEIDSDIASWINIESDSSIPGDRIITLIAPNANGQMLVIKNNSTGANTFRLANGSAVNGGGVVNLNGVDWDAAPNEAMLLIFDIFSGDWNEVGRYGTGTSAGVVANLTPSYLPYASSSNVLSDSFLYRSGTNTFTDAGMVFKSPGATNMLYSGNYGYFGLRNQDPGGNYTTLNFETGLAPSTVGYVQSYHDGLSFSGMTIASGDFVTLSMQDPPSYQVTLNSDGFRPNTAGGFDIGTEYIPFRDINAYRRWRITPYASGTNYSQLVVEHTGTNGVIFFNSASIGDAGAPRDFEFQTNGVAVAKIAAASGYSGAGTKYLSDDGTYKTLSGGDVVGPASSTDNGIVRFDGTTGKLVQNSTEAILVDKGGVFIGPDALTWWGSDNNTGYVAYREANDPNGDYNELMLYSTDTGTGESSSFDVYGDHSYMTTYLSGGPSSFNQGFVETGVTSTGRARIKVDSYLNTGGTSVLQLEDNWNEGATAFTGILANFIDTASTNTSLLMDLQVGGTSKWKATKAGATTQTGPITVNSGTVTSSSPVLDLSQTWNNAGVTFTGLKYNVVNTASASGSLLMDLQVGGTTQFNVRRDGVVAASNGFYPTGGNSFTGGGVSFVSASTVGWNSSDLLLGRDAAATLQLGADAATATAQTLKAHDGSGTDKAGADFTIAAGRPTGTGTGGILYFATAGPSTTGSSLTTQTNRVSINGTGNVVVTAAPTGTTLDVGGIIEVTTLWNEQSSLSYSATTDLDFSGVGARALSLTGNVTFTTSNRGAGRMLKVKILADASSRTFTFPSWKWIGAAAPASIAANKTAILSIECWGSNDTDVVAAYSVEQ